MAIWTVAETADAKFDIETFFTLNGEPLQNESGFDIFYYRESFDQPTYYVIHAHKEGQGNPPYSSMEFQTHLDGDNQTHAVLTDIDPSFRYQQMATLTETHTGADVASVIFQGDDTLTGSSKDDILRGYDGKDSLDGGLGADDLYGGDGDDSYVVDNSGDAVKELADNGTDLVTASVDVSLAVNVENLTLTGSADLAGTGNGLANALNGNVAGNILRGLGGADIIDGGNGDDTISGGVGVDTLTGGRGGDTFVFKLTDTGASKSSADTIVDFKASQDDLIDLHLIDANADKSGNQRFHLISGPAFTKHVGELLVTETGSETYVLGDDDGNGKADFMIHLHGAINLKAADFML
jgi:Ca2+-binding RTX toxin-like protein